jgi:hypothetical protein
MDSDMRESDSVALQSSMYGAIKFSARWNCALSDKLPIHDHHGCVPPTVA